MHLKRSLLLIAAVLTPLIIGAASPQFVQTIRSFSLSIARPFLEFQTQTSSFVTTQVRYLLEWPNLRNENQALHHEIEKLKSELLGFEETRHKANRLESILQLKENFTKKGIAARVIARDPSHWSQFVVINRGSKDGIRKNTVLINSDGLVGKVVAVGGRSARAILLTDSEARASALNQRTRDVGLVEGTGSLMLKMTYLDRYSKIQLGDTVITSGLGGIYPKGIPIGKVEMMGGEKSHMRLFAMIRPFVSFAKLEEVLCIPSQTNG